MTNGLDPPMGQSEPAQPAQPQRDPGEARPMRVWTVFAVYVGAFFVILAAEIPVIVHAPMVRAGGETSNLSMETPHLLQQAGLLTALQSGFEGYVPKTRVILYEAAIAARYGCSFDDALRLVTIDAARILGIAERVGSLEVGKDADLALYDGDPLEYTSHCIGVVIEGQVVSTVVR